MHASFEKFFFDNVEPYYVKLYNDTFNKSWFISMAEQICLMQLLDINTPSYSVYLKFQIV